MGKTRIKKGDLVQVITRVRGRRNETQRVLVEGVNRIKRHTKARPGVEGGIVEREAPIHISNVQLVDPETKKPTRVGIRTEQVERDGRTKTNRIRVAKRSGKDI
jgi:large subunit ribosomal protein L24